MADNGITNSFEAMKAELEKAGYTINGDLWGTSTEIIAPDMWTYEASFTANWERAIEAAHKHLQEKRQAQAMRELLEEISYGLKPPRHYVNEDYLDVAVAKINALLGKE